MRKVEVVPHNPNWRKVFDVESRLIADALGANVVAVHHMGSTAIPDIYAKPIIDFLVEVQDIIQVDDYGSKMESLGYQVMGEFGIPDRRFFMKDTPKGIRICHVHIFNTCSSQIKRHLGFRDYLIAHPKLADEYSELKRKLAIEYSTDIDSYIAGKAEFIKQIDRQVAQLNLQ